VAWIGAIIGSVILAAWFTWNIRYFWYLWRLIRWHGAVAQAEKRHSRGHCWRCGYDLTGNVSGVCPECGEDTGHAR
jgi:hypothetical protein